MLAVGPVLSAAGFSGPKMLRSVGFCRSLKPLAASGTSSGMKHVSCLPAQIESAAMQEQHVS
jgi:hypothetical protein